MLFILLLLLSLSLAVESDHVQHFATYCVFYYYGSFKIFLYLCIDWLHVDAEAKAKIQKLEEAAAKGVILYVYNDS